jgi:hypothetical protein
MPAQAAIPSQTLNYHRWGEQSITRENEIHKLSFQESSPSKDNNRKQTNKTKTKTKQNQNQPTKQNKKKKKKQKTKKRLQGQKLRPRKSKKVILQQT